MKQPILAFTTMLTVTLAISSVANANEQTDKQALLEAYRTIEVGSQRKDFNQVFSVYAPEYTGVSLDKKVSNLEQTRQNTQRNLQYIRKINMIRHEHKQIQINGQTATVLGIGYLSAIVSNPKNPQVTAPMSGVWQYQDTWKRTPGGWKITNSHTLQQNVAVGRPQGIQMNNANLNPGLYQQNIDMIRSGSRSLECALETYCAPTYQYPYSYPTYNLNPGF